MWMYLCLILGCGTIFGVAIMLASKNGSKAAQLEALRAELKKQYEEQQRAKKITDNVNSFDDDDVRKRLQNISSKQR